MGGTEAGSVQTVDGTCTDLITSIGIDLVNAPCNKSVSNIYQPESISNNENLHSRSQSDSELQCLNEHNRNEINKEANIINTECLEKNESTCEVFPKSLENFISER